MSTSAGHVTAGDGPTITEEDGEETDRSSGDYSGRRYGETTNFGKESERTRDHFSVTNGSGTVLDADARIQTEKEVNLADETSRFMKPVSDGIFSANKAGNDFMEMRGSILNEKYGNMATDKSGFREPPFLGFSSTFNGGRGKAVSPQDFNMSEFLNLANRVVDTGDAAAIEVLAKLKTRWEEKFGLIGNLRTQRNFGRPTIKPRRCILERVTKTTRREGSTAMVTIDIPSVEKLQTTEIEKTSDSGDKLAGSNGEDGCPGGVPSSDLAAVIEKQSEGMIQSAVISGLEVSPENQSWPESGHIPTTNSSPPTCADVDPVKNDVENAIDLEADVGICAEVMHEVLNDVMDDVAADFTGDVSNNVEKISPTITQVRSFPMGVFVGNIPLNANSNMGVDDKIADAFFFLCSISYVNDVLTPPSMRIPLNVVHPVSIGPMKSYLSPDCCETLSAKPALEEKHSKSVISGYCHSPPLITVLSFADSSSPRSLGARANISIRGPGTTNSATEMGAGYADEEIKTYTGPVWIKLRHLPVELWTEEGLSTVASGIGKPLYPDAITRACTRLDFARVCVMLDVSSKLHKHIIIMTPDEEGGETPCKIDVEYEWIPSKRTRCMTLGHSAKDCALNKPSKPIKPQVAVYVPKTGPAEPITVHDQTVDIPWLIGGDFNAVRDISEICGASGDIRMAMEEFNNCVQNAGLLPLPMQREWYTWHNCSASPRNLWKRLDRMMINDRWMARFPTSFYTSLTPRTSDHSPLVLYGDSQQQYGGMFRFDNYLTRSPEFIPSVQQVWQHNIIGVPMYAGTRKLKALKPVFREQRRNKGDLSHNVQLAKGFLEIAQILVSSNRQDELFLQLEHCFRFILAKVAKLEQSMLQQRAKMQWMKGVTSAPGYSFVRLLNGDRLGESYKSMMIMEPLTQNHKRYSISLSCTIKTCLVENKGET
ncbi:UNVERIFIED_CONTAM: hypothetical protein Sindi_0942200 [Sesamum indicum]